MSVDTRKESRWPRESECGNSEVDGAVNYLGKQRGRREKKGYSFTPGDESRENQDPELLPGQLLLPQRKQTQFLAQGPFPAPVA